MRARVVACTTVLLVLSSFAMARSALAFKLLQPADGSTVPSVTVFDWEDVPGATGYDLIFSVRSGISIEIYKIKKIRASRFAFDKETSDIIDAAFEEGRRELGGGLFESLLSFVFWTVVARVESDAPVLFGRSAAGSTTKADCPPPSRNATSLQVADNVYRFKRAPRSDSRNRLGIVRGLVRSGASSLALAGARIRAADRDGKIAAVDFAGVCGEFNLLVSPGRFRIDLACDGENGMDCAGHLPASVARIPVKTGKYTDLTEDIRLLPGAVGGAAAGVMLDYLNR